LPLFFVEHCDTATNILSESANPGDVAEGLTTALDVQKPLVSDLRGQGAQCVGLCLTSVTHTFRKKSADGCSTTDLFNRPVIVRAN
jgi:hypothetical protein